MRQIALYFSILQFVYKITIISIIKYYKKGEKYLGIFIFIVILPCYLAKKISIQNICTQLREEQSR